MKFFFALLLFSASLAVHARYTFPTAEASPVLEKAVWEDVASQLKTLRGEADEDDDDEDASLEAK